MKKMERSNLSFPTTRKVRTNTHLRGSQLQSVFAVDTGGKIRSDYVSRVEQVPPLFDNIAREISNRAFQVHRTSPVRGASSNIVKRGCMDGSSDNITGLLRAASSGDRQDVDALMAAIYADLRRIADNQLHRERPDHTLQPTALVHEAYLKLIDQRSTDWKDRAHFFSIAARVIRRILVDHAREKKAQKRGGEYRRVEIETTELGSSGTNPDLIDLDDSLRELAELNSRQAQIVEMRFFGGLTLEEIAGALGIARRSVDREWAAARAWLYVRLADSIGG